MKAIGISAGEKQSETLVLGNKQLSAVYLPPTDEVIVFTVLTGHDLDHIGPTYKDAKLLTFESDPREYKVCIFNPADFEAAQVLAFRTDRKFTKAYNIWVYLHTF